MRRKFAIASVCVFLIAILGSQKHCSADSRLFSTTAEASNVTAKADATDAEIAEAFGPNYGCVDDAYSGVAYNSASGPGAESVVDAGDGNALGGDIPPLRTIFDPYPSFNGIALDIENKRVFMSDTNRKSLLSYDRASGVTDKEVSRPLRRVMGPETGIGFVAGVTADPVHHEAFIVNNDIEDRMVAFSYDAEGNSKPERVLYVPHQAWGLSLSRARDEIAMTVQAPNMVVFYHRTAKGLEAPLRKIRGPHTGMADPHGVRVDDTNNEVVVANHGNWRPEDLITAYTAYDDPGNARAAHSGDAAKPAGGGEFRPSSITVYSGTAAGDASPLRTIQGPRTQLDWPMGIDVDAVNNEIAVCNNGNNSVTVFRRTANGDVAPIRVIRGRHTGINNPMGIALDNKNGELWVANFGDHNALVFSRTADGDAAPKRIIWNAPPGSPTSGFGNPYCAVYDPNHDTILVPN